MFRIFFILLLVSLAAGSARAGDLVPRLLKSAGGFAHSHDVVLSPDGKLLYVGDIGKDRVAVLDSETLELRGVIGKGELSSPHDVAFDGAGRLLVADSGNDRIVIYSADGKRLDVLKHEMGSPEGVAAGADGAIYVANASRHTVQKFKDGKLIASLGRYGSGPGEFVRPHDLDIGPDGNLYVVDAGNHRIQILSLDLKPLSILGGKGFDFNEPKYIAFDPQDRLFVADEYNHQLKIFDKARKRIAVIGDGTKGDPPQRLNKPEGVTVRGDLMWMSDTYNDRVLLFRLEEK